MAAVININIQGLVEQLEFIKKSISNIENVINTLNNNNNKNINNEIKNDKPKKIYYRKFIINENNSKNMKIKIDQFYKKTKNNYYNSEESNNSTKLPNPNFVTNNKFYEHIPLENLIKQLDVALSCEHIIEVLRNNPEKNKEYSKNNYNFIFYKNIISLFILITSQFLDKIQNSNNNDKLKIFEELVEFLLTYKIFFTDKLFDDEFLNFKKVITRKTIEFSSIYGSNVAWLMFAYLNPDMISDDCYLHLKFNSNDNNKNININNDNIPNIKKLYEQYASYIDKNKHVINDETNYPQCDDCGHVCGENCDDECLEYYYEGEYYDYCKYCNDHCSCE